MSATIDIDKICKTWTNDIFICKWKGQFVLVTDADKQEEEILSTEQAEQIISKLKLVALKNGGLKDAFNYYSQKSVRERINALELEKRTKENEIKAINSVLYDYNYVLRKEEIKLEENFDSWKLAKKNLGEEYGISDEFKKKVEKLTADHWKKALTENLNYEEEYLCIMQYDLIVGANAEMGRSHGKGTFGYRNKGITEDEHKKMREVENSNFEKYLKKINFNSFDEFEGVSQDGEGGYHFEELEDK
jgi:hypothetical protein